MDSMPVRLRKGLSQAQRRAMREARRHGLRATISLAKHGLWTPRVTGIVEEVNRTLVEGWITVPADTPPVRVTLSVRNVAVAVTWAVPDEYRQGPQEIRRFRFLIQDLWDYLRKGDTIVIRANRNVLPVFKSGMHIEVTTKGTKEFAVLRKRVAAGWVFSKGGRLQRPKSGDTQWQQDTFAFADEVSAAIAEDFGLETFTNYGALLGAVRNGGFIDHDNDLDISYISACRSGPEAAEEFKRVALALVDRGYWVRCIQTHMSVRTHDGWSRWLDIFPLYFDADGVLRFPFGVAGTTRVTLADWKGTRRVDFASGHLTVPVNAEQMVEAVYGPNWRQPDPGFAWSRDRTDKAPEGQLSQEGCEEVYWANFWAHAERAEPSPFFAWLAVRPDVPSAVVDLGCGDGRDAGAFAATGRPVLGIDRSQVGIRRAAERARELGADAARFEVCDVADAEPLRKVLTDAVERDPAAPVLFYARFLLHVLTAEGQQTLLDVLDSVARPGDMVAVEFRTTADEKLPKTHPRHFRRYQDSGAFAAELRARRFEVVDSAEGDNLSPYKDENPVLYRVLARRTA